MLYVVASILHAKETVPSQAPRGFDVRRENVPAGKVETVTYDSKSVGIERSMLIYTPPGYSDEQKYPVLYLLHEIGDVESDWTAKGAADAVLDNLIAEKKAVPMEVETRIVFDSVDPGWSYLKGICSL